MYCRCINPSSYTVNIVDGEPNNDLWVCAACLRPSRLVYGWDTAMHCPPHASALLSVYCNLDGTNMVAWAAADGTRITTMSFTPYLKKVGMPEVNPILQDLWKQLDAVTATLVTHTSVGDENFEKGYARGLATAIYNCMKPFYNSSDEVVREAVTRFKANQAGTQHETPGLAEAIWDPATDYRGKSVQKTSGRPSTPGISAPARTTTKRKTAPVMTPEQITAAKSALDGGIPAATVAGLFKVPVEVIQGL